MIWNVEMTMAYWQWPRNKWNENVYIEDDNENNECNMKLLLMNNERKWQCIVIIENINDVSIDNNVWKGR